MLYSRLVDGRPTYKLRAGRGRGSHKAGYGTASTGAGPTAVTGPRRPHWAARARRPGTGGRNARSARRVRGLADRGPPGHGQARRTAGRGADGGVCHRPDPQPAHPRGVRHGRDAVLHLVRRARDRARTAVADRRGHLHRRHTRPVSRPYDQAASGRHPPAVRLAGDRAGDAPQPGRLGARADPRREDRQDAGAAARRSAAVAGFYRHRDPPRPARSRAAGRDGLQLCARLGRRRHARRGLLPAGQALVAAAPGKRRQTPRRAGPPQGGGLSTPISTQPESRPRKTRPCGARCRGPAGWARAG